MREANESVGPVLFDTTGLGSAASRSTVIEAMDELGMRANPYDTFWAGLLEGDPSGQPRNVLVVADLSHAARAFTHTNRHRWTAFFRIATPHLLAFVRNRRDQACADLVDDILRSSDLRFTLCGYDVTHHSELLECLNNAVSALRPDSVVDVRNSQDTKNMVIEFSDGLIASIPWRDVVRDTAALIRESATTGETRRTVEVLALDGDVYSIDTASIRALADPTFAGQIEQRAFAANRAIGERLKEKRLAKGITQTDLSDLSGLEQSLISKLERGRHSPRFDTLEKYAGGLDTSVADLLSDADTGPPARAGRRKPA